MSEFSATTKELASSSDVTGDTKTSSASGHTLQQSSKNDNGLKSNGTSDHPPTAFMQDPQKKKTATQEGIEKFGDALGAFGKFTFNAFSFFMYMVGLFGFLCGAAVPIITLWFFLNVDVMIRWWHIVLGIGGNIGIFIVSMNMIRDLYVEPLIEKIEAAQARAEWGEPPARG
jgi:hypothetical protein